LELTADTARAALHLLEMIGLRCMICQYIQISVETIDHIYIEKQQAMPKQGVSSTFKLGYAFGQIVTSVALFRRPYTLVTPVTWKRSMNLPRDKDAARRMAQQWFPDIASDLKRKKDEHRAEALLIALYGRGKA
jgi:crossover junction endodeoxyribonuclease RuvC